MANIPIVKNERLDVSYPVGVIGNGNLTYSIALCLMRAGYTVHLCTDDALEAENTISGHISDMTGVNGAEKMAIQRLWATQHLENIGDVSLAIVITAEDIDVKTEAIIALEEILSPSVVIAVNTESIALDDLQRSLENPSRLIGLNWTEPAHTTRFLEIITNDITPPKLTDEIVHLAKAWSKDAYVVSNLGIRSRLMSAMIREAFYLVENGYASREDIDRACRNDAGYYLPFAGNCRYMDLMGTYAYGLVMKDLNPDLSQKQVVPEFFEEIIRDGGEGMKNGCGLYQYSPQEIKIWREVFNEFSYLIQNLMNKYPFNYLHQDRA